MADVISRLRLESGEFDSKIKRAGQEIMAYSEHCRKMGLEMGYANKDAKDFAKSLGSMQTTSTTARGKINELSDAFVNLRVMYKQMTDEEKNNQFGKNLAASLDQLKTRINAAKADLADVTVELNGAGKATGGGIFEGLSSKMEGALAVFGGNLMTKAAGAVANLGSEMYGMVQQGIEMARAGEGIRIAFERLGRGDILDGLRQATHGTVTDLELMKAAVKFNDFKLPLDELGTMLAFAQQKAKDTGQSVDYMVDSIVTGLGRKSLMILDNLGLSATEIRERMKETGDMTKAVGAIIRDQMAAAGDYVETAADRAAQANVSLQNKMEELGRKFAPVEEASNQLWTSMKIGILDIIGGPLARLLNSLTEAGRLKNALNDINGDGSGGSETRTDKALRMLREYSGRGAEGKKDLYNRQVAKFQEQEERAWRKVNEARKKYDDELKKSQTRNSASGVAGGTANMALTGYENAIKKAEAEAKAFQIARATYEKGAQDILNPKPINTGTVGTTDPNKKTGKTTKEEITYASDSIMAQEKLISDLTQKWKTASGELRDGYLKQLDEAKAKLKEMTAVNVVPGSLQDYQNKLKDANAEVLTIREELLRMQKSGEDPVDIQVKKDELEIAIERVNSLQSDIDTLNGKTAEINIHLGIDGMPIGDTQMGEEMVNGLSTSLVNAADNLDLSGFTTALQQAMANGLGDMGEADFSEYLEYMKEQLGDQISEQEWPTIEMAIKTGNIEELKEYIKKLQKAGTDTKEAWKGAAGSIAQLGSALQSIEDPGVKAAGTVIAAIANVALGFANASKGPFTSPWEWIAFVASGLATMITTIGTIHSITGYANGGIYDGPSGFVPGNSFSGDNVMANGGTVGLNSGELILNRAQQGVIAQELEGGGFDNLQLDTVISGEDIRLVLNNNGRRTGSGEYVQSRK